MWLYVLDGEKRYAYIAVEYSCEGYSHGMLRAAGSEDCG